MRQIGTLSDGRQAQRLADYLLTRGIRVEIEPEKTGPVMWVIDEDHVAPARAELQAFLEHPDDEKYAAAERAARRLRDDLIRREKARQKNVVDVRQSWASPRGKPLTVLLITVSCVVAILTRFGEDWSDDRVVQKLVIAEYRPDGNYIRWYGLARSWTNDPFADPPRFQFWRLITPIFLHGGPAHLIMNMMALHVEGTLIETRRGTWRMALMVLMIALLSNLAEYGWSHHPNFGGMSGVGFGLFGYVWMKSEFDPAAGIVTSQYNVFMMLGWLVLCMTGWVGPIANAAHFAGLVIGILLGYGPVLYRQILRR
jgi:GlpG protein